ncbi:MAG: hypothetical protein JJ913_12650 [Rhizobiaceae bacterium]|nr:hypothetical protein [Rhizobiaceae bacterium]
MHVKDTKALKGNKSAPFNPLSANAALSGGPVKPTPDNKLSAAFAAALGKSARGADTPPASAGKDQTRGGPGRPDEINKASKPATGRKNFSGHRSGHR